MNGLRRFIDDPGAWVDPAQVAPLIAPGLMPETAQRLFTTPRTAGRATQLLAQHLGHGDPAALDPADARLLCADAPALEEIATRAGCVWHAGRVRALIANAEIMALTARFGVAARDAALRHMDLAAGSGAGSDDLHADIMRDGVHCITAWISTLPDWAAARMRLKWPDAQPPTEIAARTRIVRNLAGEG